MSISSDMNVSWSTISPAVSFKSNSTSVFSSSSRKSRDGKALKRPDCVSAKHTGMRFQSWREPKPLRSRAGSANIAMNGEQKVKNREPPRSPRKSAEPTRKQTEQSRKQAEPEMEKMDSQSVVSSSDGGQSLNAMVSRLSLPTKASKIRTIKSREAGTDMNWYSWSKMNVYKDYQGVLYGDNGVMKSRGRNKER